jgi:hypothetical protein
MEIFNQFLGRNLVNFEEIYENLEDNIAKTKDILKNLQKMGFLYLIESLEVVKLSKKGENAISDFKDNLYLKIQEVDVPKKSLLKALIISDKFGRTLITFESISNFISSLKVNEDVSSNPELISMFYSAINDFGLTIEKNGFSKIEFTGEKYNLLFLRKEEIFGIFFIEKLDNKKKMNNIISEFLTEFYNSYQEQIAAFFETGSLKDVIQIRKSLILKIKNLNKKLLAIYQF